MAAPRIFALALALVLALAAFAAASCARPVAPPTAPAADARPAIRGAWRSQTGTCAEIPEWEVHEIDRDFYILRQSPCTSYEKPFVFVLFGGERALLLDTGAGEHNGIAAAVAHLARQWLARTGRASIPLIVAHTHEHGDHTAGDAELAALRLPELPIEVTPLELEATKRRFAIARWPDDLGQLDLGGRILDAIPLPGHSKLSIALYDRRTATVFSGDTLYPGRLYMSDIPAFEASIERLVRFTADRPVAQLLGNHVEQTALPFRDYPIGTIFQPDEHELALSRGSLLELHAALAAMHGAPRRLALRDITLWPSGPAFLRRDEIERAERCIADQERAKWTRSVQLPASCAADAP